MTVSLALLFGLGFGYLAVVLAFAARQDALFFQPKLALAATPTDAGLTYREVALLTPDEVTLHAWWLPGPSSPPVGSPRPPLHAALSARRQHQPRRPRGCVAVLARAGFRHPGDRLPRLRPQRRSTTEAGLYVDVRTAWDWLTGQRGVAPARIVVAAESLGVSLATHLALETTPAGLVLEAGFTRAADVAARRYPWLPVRQVIRLRLANDERVARLRCRSCSCTAWTTGRCPSDTRVGCCSGRRRRACCSRSAAPTPAPASKAVRATATRYSAGSPGWT